MLFRSKRASSAMLAMLLLSIGAPVVWLACCCWSEACPNTSVVNGWPEGRAADTSPLEAGHGQVDHLPVTAALGLSEELCFVRDAPPLLESDGQTSLQDLLLVVSGEGDLPSRLGALHELAARDGSGVETALETVASNISLPVRVRREAILLMSGKPCNATHRTLLANLRSDLVDLRIAAIQGIGVLGSSDLSRVLPDALDGESCVAVVRAILQSMGSIGTPELVIALLDHSSSERLPCGVSRSEVLGALGGISNPSAVRVLVDGLSRFGDLEARRSIVSALSRIADTQTYDLLLALVNTDPDLIIRCRAIQGLGMIGDPRAVPTLRQLALSTTSASEKSYARTAVMRIESSVRH